MHSPVRAVTAVLCLREYLLCVMNMQMGYTPDDCRTGFTPLQISRMQATWVAIREGF